MGPNEAMKMIRGMDHLSCENRLILTCFFLEKRSFWGDLRAGFQYPKGGSKRAGEGQFAKSYSGRRRGNGFKLSVDGI